MVADAQSRRARLPGRGARPDHLRPRVAAARRLRRAGTRSASSTGRCATGSARAPRGLPVDADFGAFWRDFEWMGVQRQLKVLGIFARLVPPRRQGRLPRGHAARDGATCAARASATASSQPLLRLLDALDGHARAGGRLHVLMAARDGDDPRRRARRAHAAAVRHDAQAAARGRRQAADRLADRGAGARRASATSSINASHLADRSIDALGDGARARRRASAGRARPSRSRPPAASRRRCRCSPTGRRSSCPATCGPPTTTRRCAGADAMARRRRAPRVHLVMVPNPPYHPRGRFRARATTAAPPLRRCRRQADLRQHRRCTTPRCFANFRAARSSKCCRCCSTWIGAGQVSGELLRGPLGQRRHARRTSRASTPALAHRADAADLSAPAPDHRDMATA